MSVSDQMMKGLLDAAILGLIAHGETYGYEITKRLEEKKFPDISEGSIYPVLLRLSKKKYVTTRMVKSDTGGPKRKYYSITDSGLEELDAFAQKWNKLNSGMNNILGGIDDVKS